MSSTQLLSTWREHLHAAAAGLHLVDSDHPLQVFVGCNDAGAPRMVLRGSSRPTKPTLSDVVLVERYEDGSGKWNLSFTLQHRKFEEVFLRLADDLHARSSPSPNEQTAWDKVGVVFDEWRRLLKPRPSGLLTMEELRGLIGELWLVQNEFAASHGIAGAIEGWLGPMGLPQDFWFEDYGYCEAKAIGPATTRVRISSEHQLDEDELVLSVIRIGNTDESGVGSVNLPVLVTRVRGLLAEEGEPADALDERLSRLGVDLAEPFYSDTWFVVSTVTNYDVNAAFPRIIASTLPTGVTRVTYQIDLADIEPFEQAGTVIQ